MAMPIHYSWTVLDNGGDIHFLRMDYGAVFLLEETRGQSSFLQKAKLVVIICTEGKIGQSSFPQKERSFNRQSTIPYIEVSISTYIHQSPTQKGHQVVNNPLPRVKRQSKIPNREGSTGSQQSPASMGQQEVNNPLHRRISMQSTISHIKGSTGSQPSPTYCR